MRFNFNLKGNIQNMMRGAGYYFEGEERGEVAFIRPLSSAGSGYPRFHIYLNVSRETYEVTANLHLDQKKPSYKGTSSHNAEYDGKLVEREAERIKKTLSGL